jgi:hypothetical protein
MVLHLLDVQVTVVEHATRRTPTQFGSRVSSTTTSFSPAFPPFAVNFWRGRRPSPRGCPPPAGFRSPSPSPSPNPQVTGNMWGAPTGNPVRGRSPARDARAAFRDASATIPAPAVPTPPPAAWRSDDPAHPWRARGLTHPRPNFPGAGASHQQCRRNPQRHNGSCVARRARRAANPLALVQVSVIHSSSSGNGVVTDHSRSGRRLGLAMRHAEQAVAPGLGGLPERLIGTGFQPVADWSSAVGSNPTPSAEWKKGTPFGGPLLSHPRIAY